MIPHSFFALALTFSISGAFAQTPQVQSFNPTGSVKAVQQVTVRFATDMMAMGDPKTKNEPFKYECKGHNSSTMVGAAAAKTLAIPRSSTRWADSRNWVVDFDKPLPAGVRCMFTVNSGAKDLAGLQLTAPEYSFATAGPMVLGMNPRYADIEPGQYFAMRMDGELDPKSIETGAYFEIEGTADRVPAKVITGKDRDIVLNAAVENEWEWREFEKLAKATKKTPAQLSEMKMFVVIGAKRNFPEGKKVVLHWTTGVKSKTGMPVSEEQDFSFTVVDSFKATFTCERAFPGRPCNPVLEMKLDLSRGLDTEKLAGAKMTSADGRVWIPKELAKTSKEKQTRYLTFAGPFPEKTKFMISLPKLQDDIGRNLSNQNKYPLEVATDEYSPLIKFAAPFGILELKAEPLLPVSVRNVETSLPAQQTFADGKSLTLTKATDMIAWLQKIEDKEGSYEKRGQPLLEQGKGEKFQLPKPLGEREFELIGIPLKKPGLHIVELKSPKLGAALLGKGEMYVASAALVTDMGVHLKKGRESSVVWVTQLSDAKPVEGAKVSLVTTGGKVLAEGKTDARGIFNVGKVDYPCGFESTETAYDKCPVYAFAQKGEDISFVSSRWSQGIESYRFSVANEYLNETWGPLVMHTVLDRMAVQPGEKINFKHVLREYRMNGFAIMNPKYLPKRVMITHTGSQKTYTLPFTYDPKTGSALNTFTVPKEATLGTYVVTLSNKADAKKKEQGDASDDYDYSAQMTGTFVVSEYRLPLMKATVKIQGAPLVAPASVKVDVSAAYLSGGPAKDLKVKIRSNVTDGYFQPDVPGSSDFNFFSQPVKTGMVQREQDATDEEAFLKVQDLTLNKDGGSLVTLSKLPPVRKIKNLNVEMEFMDPNGETKTVGQEIPLFPADFVVGLRSEDWYTEPGKAKVAGVITDNSGKVRANQAFTVEAFTFSSFSHRKRLVGGFYSYDSKDEIKAIGKVCEGQSDQYGRFQCQPSNLPVGTLILQAKTDDSKGRSTYARTNIQVRAPGEDSWYTPSDSDRIDLLPEKNSYEPGDKAKVVVRSPFQTATALVTIEREGVLDSFVTTVTRDNPVIEIPLKGHYAPNIFVSALLIRGRVNDARPTALVDLSRPAMKMGLVQLKVGWKEHRLTVAVSTDKKKYKAREKAKVAVQVTTPDGKPLTEGSEVALVAVDEALLRLKENTSWKILEALMGERGLAVQTSSGQNQIIGKRHFGAKAKPPGGGGGMAADPRQLFDPILAWNPKMVLDKNGRTEMTIALNDSITSFRIVAVALGGANLFGNGETTIESSKDLILYSGFAPLVRDGDQVGNAFTVRNTTAQAMKVVLKLSAKELHDVPALAPVELKPSEAKTISLPLKVPLNVKEINYRLEAKDSVTGSEDILLTKVKVDPAVPVQVQQATLFQLDKEMSIPVRQPADNIAGQGGLQISARSTLVTGLAGVRAYMTDYPYSCLEQQTSKAIALEDAKDIERVINILPSYQDGNGLLKFFSSSMCGSVPLTRYVLAIMGEGGHVIPEATVQKMAAGLQGFAEGKANCRTWYDETFQSRHREELRVLAVDGLSRAKKFRPEIISTLKITPNLWKTETLVAWTGLLKRESTIPGRDEQLKQAMTLLRSRMNFQGTLMNLQGDLGWEAAWQLLSSNDKEAMGVFGIAIKDDSWSQDIGRMARGVTARLKKGTWDTTLANAWGITFLRQFSAKYEKEKPAGLTKIKADEIAAQIDWTKNPAGEQQLLVWPKSSTTQDVKAVFKQEGAGKPWVQLQIMAARPLKAPRDLGYSIERKITPVLQATAGQWKVGDVANISLKITAKADQAWVVIKDAVPAGASHLGSALSGGSALLDRAPKKADDGTSNAWPEEFSEKSFANFISYAAYLPKGTYLVNYRVRLNSSGTFQLPPTRVEAMYAPETFGETPNASWVVAP